MRTLSVAPALVTWTSFATGQTASRPGCGYWVGMGTRAGRFEILVAYSETMVGHYAVESESEACLVHQRLLAPRDRPEARGPTCSPAPPVTISIGDR